MNIITPNQQLFHSSFSFAYPRLYPTTPTLFSPTHPQLSSWVLLHLPPRTVVAVMIVVAIVVDINVVVVHSLLALWLCGDLFLFVLFPSMLAVSLNKQGFPRNLFSTLSLSLFY